MLGKTVEEAQQIDGVKDIFDNRGEGHPASDSQYEPGQIVEQDRRMPDARRKSNLVIQVYVGGRGGEGAHAECTGHGCTGRPSIELQAA